MVAADGGTLVVPGLGVEARGIALVADLDLDTKLAQGMLSAAEVHDRRDGQPLPPAAFELRFAPGPGGMVLDGALRDLQGRIAAHLHGTHDLATHDHRPLLNLGANCWLVWVRPAMQIVGGRVTTERVNRVPLLACPAVRNHRAGSRDSPPA